MDEFSEIEAHLKWVAGVEFATSNQGSEQTGVRVLANGVESVMVVTRDSEPAAPGDVEFVAHCVGDLHGLYLMATSTESARPEFLTEIAARVEAASPAPWCACIEADGGLGGCDVILVGPDDSDDPDLYLWVDGSLAPSDYLRFVAAARQDIPRLLEAVRARHPEV
ncbi:MAG: hypothetical protein LWW77_04385 [Propionibacteriales bacterium]|nr:hypothetical protein [Propionibacteriales bacterium]